MKFCLVRSEAALMITFLISLILRRLENAELRLYFIYIGSNYLSNYFFFISSFIRGFSPQYFILTSELKSKPFTKFFMGRRWYMKPLQEI